ncbi:protein FAR1-RELATED SEQUENCE 5-like [Bidens hawaiensis]|uniref:protein FAR1-RELATED SEQUENCE 5-like n=1 Tax=Bidens hawaiensis TaxID=980011 RepID=UPI00404A0662
MNESKQRSVNNNGIGYSVVKPLFNHNYTSNPENDHVTKFASVAPLVVGPPNYGISNVNSVKCTVASDCQQQEDASLVEDSTLSSFNNKCINEDDIFVDSINMHVTDNLNSIIVDCVDDVVFETMINDNSVSDDSSVLVEGQGVDIIPEVASSYRPVKGMMFSSIDQAFDFYSEYAKKAEFGAREGGSYMHGGVLKTKYFTCCKEGHKPAKMYDSKGDCNESSKPYYQRRKRPPIRCGCRAHIQLKSVNGEFFQVDDFVEGHNHKMVADSNMKFVRSARKLTHVQEEAIYEMSNMNLGPVKAFNLMRTQYGGFEKVGATKDDCKNFKQGLNCYIGEYDAEMIVQRLCAKKTFSSEYSFEYYLNDNRELIRMFWADETSKSNYLAFGDIISFDATLRLTSKYKMVFVPFTTIDNHCHSVTVGAGLLASETIESYTWLLQMFLKSFDHAPKVVVTDQDPAMKQAIAAVFPNTRRRLCMWHIMKKVADKVGADLCNNEDFKSRLCNIVWTDSISPSEFEENGRL